MIEYNGLKFYQRKKGHYQAHTGEGQKSTTLHQAKWAREICPILPKYVIHHIDEDPGNNALNNLMMLPRFAHNRLHMRAPEKKKIVAKNAIKARKAWLHKFNYDPEHRANVLAALDRGRRKRG